MERLEKFCIRVTDLNREEVKQIAERAAIIKWTDSEPCQFVSNNVYYYDGGYWNIVMYPPNDISLITIEKFKEMFTEKEER